MLHKNKKTHAKAPVAEILHSLRFQLLSGIHHLQPTISLRQVMAALDWNSLHVDWYNTVVYIFIKRDVNEKKIKVHRFNSLHDGK